VRRALACALLAGASLAATGAALAAGIQRVTVEGVAAVAPRVPGAPAAPPPSAAQLRQLREQALGDGIEKAVLGQAARLAREDARGDAAGLKAALPGSLADYTSGFGVLADLGERDAVPPPGAAPAKRRPQEPIPREHAWRIEALVDTDRVGAALRAAGIALVGAGESGGDTLVLLEPPFDAQALAALRAQLRELGAARVVPERFSAAGVSVRATGLPPDALAHRLGLEPPEGYAAQLEGPTPEDPSVRVRLVRSAEPAPAAAGTPAAAPKLPRN
jgi:hypothetical protein